MKYRYLKAGDVRQIGDEWVMRNSSRCLECGAYQHWAKVYDFSIGKRITKSSTRSIIYRRPVVRWKVSRARPTRSVKKAVK